MALTNGATNDILGLVVDQSVLIMSMSASMIAIARYPHGRGWPLVQSTFRLPPEPFLSLKPPKYTTKSAYVELKSGRV